MMNDLDLDATYERYRDGHIADLDGLWIPEWQIEKDVKDLIAEVRRLRAENEDIEYAWGASRDGWLKINDELTKENNRLRAMLDIAADEFDDYIKDNRNSGPGTTKLLNHWAEEVKNK